MCQKGDKLSRKFYLKNTLQVAKELLGKYLVHDDIEGKTVGKIVETEAYLGTEDPASHVYESGKTDRTRIQYGLGGHAYVYLIYGMYHCLNVVTGDKGEPKSVLIRALEPIEGEELMRERRGLEVLSGKNRVELTNGPGKLCMAMGINKDDSGKDLKGDEIYIIEPAEKAEKDNFEIVSGKRINVDYAEEAKRLPWRFYIKNNNHASQVL